MNQNSLLIASAISIIFALSKYIECKFIVKEDLNIKSIVRDTILVYISAISGLFVIAQVNTKLDPGPPSTSAFINKPDF